MYSTNQLDLFAYKYVTDGSFSVPSDLQDHERNYFLTMRWAYALHESGSITIPEGREIKESAMRFYSHGFECNQLSVFSAPEQTEAEEAEEAEQHKANERS